MTPWQERVLAFSGTCLAAVCVQQLARRGEVIAPATISPLLESTLRLNAESTADIYGDLEAMKPGLQILIGQLEGTADKDVEQTQYVVRMLQLERLLMKRPAALDKLRAGLEQIVRQRDEFNFDPYRIRQNLGELYSDVISPLGPRIQVHGKPDLLQQPVIQHQVRAVLLAGIRSAVLWRQLGGKRRQIIFNRSKMVNAAKQLMQTSI
ncbi:MAG: high frequency lysogenization protein HflD [Idiomarina sp.]|nr:high frequency lysogenization protein HflD [Idiomarina sp.]